MKTVQEYIDFLVERGFKIANGAYLYLDGVLQCVDMDNDKNNVVVQLGCYPSKEFQDFLDDLDVGDQYEHDMNQYYVDNVCVSGSICTETNFYNGENNGIVLMEDISSEGVQPYHTHLLTPENLEKAINAQTYPSEHMMEILEKHLANIKAVKKNFIPTLKKYDFFESYNSITYLADGETAESTSDILAEFTHRNSGHSLYLCIASDCFDGRLKVNHFEDIDFYTISQEEFEKIFIDRILTNKSVGSVLNNPHNNIKLEYSYMFDDDPKNNIHTFGDVMNCLSIINRDFPSIYEIDKIGPNNIPDWAMKWYDKAVEHARKVNVVPEE